MADRRHTQSKIPQIPKRNPSRATPTNPPPRKRQPDLPSLRHDKRSGEVKSKDNDRKRRGKIYFEQYSARRLDGGKVSVNNAESQGEEDRRDSEVLIDDYYGHNVGVSPLEAPATTKSSDALYDPSQQGDSAVDLSAATPDLDGTFDLSEIKVSLLPKPLSLKSKLSIDITQRTPNMTIAKVPSKDQSKPISRTPTKASSLLNPATKSCVPYSDSEYSEEEICRDGVTKKSKTKRRDDDPRKYNHDVELYLNTENYAVKSKESEELPEMKDLLVSNDPLLEETEPTKDSDIDSMENTDEHEIIFDSSDHHTRKIQGDKKQVTDPILWFEVETRSRIFTKASKVHLQCRSHISQSKEPHGRWLLDIKVEFIQNRRTIAFTKGTFIQRNLIKANFLEAIKSAGQAVSNTPIELFDRTSEDHERKWDAKIGSGDSQFNCASEMAADKYFESGLEGDARLERLASTHPIHWATMKLSETECIKLYEEMEEENKISVLGRRDLLFRNVLHIAASEQKPECIMWMLERVRSISGLKSARNLGGYTPLEELEAKLEAHRTTTPYFTGFPMKAVICLSALRYKHEVDAIDSERLRFGCTCHGCVGGFMSSRTQFALVCKATKIYHSLDRSKSTDDEWTEDNADVLRYVKPEIQTNLALSEHLRQGFINIFFHIAQVIESQQIPSTESIKINAWEMMENNPHVPGFLFTGGTTEAAIQVVFEMARDSDEWVGDGDHQEEFKTVHDDLPKCRNDHEWELVTT
ncbi:hypothetical protein IFR05_002414 [Cadophora sp. M221]|nr:hypothetical protein IFR05_002414 [Cadophora sp. M221]